MTNKNASQEGEQFNATDPCWIRSPRRILVVDDEPVIRSLTTAALVRSGYEVDDAQDGAAAWIALKGKNYDLLITDNSMPKITGIGLVKMLRNDASRLPVIMVTGAHPTEDLERYPSLDISAILLKPYAIEDLLKAVKKIFNETKTVATTRQLQLLPDLKSIAAPIDLKAEEFAENVVLEEPLPRL